MPDLLNSKNSLRNYYEENYIRCYDLIDEEDLGNKFSMLKPFFDESGMKGTVLDIGCGNGWMTKRVRESYGCKTIGLDLSFAALESGCNRGTDRAQCDAENLCVKREGLGLLYFVDLLEHLPSPLDFLKSLRGMGTDLLMFIPMESALLNDLIFIYRRIMGKETTREVYGHIQRFNEKRLLSLLRKAGFDNIRYRIMFYDSFRQHDSFKGRMLDRASGFLRALSPWLHRHIFGCYAFVALFKPGDKG